MLGEVAFEVEGLPFAWSQRSQPRAIALTWLPQELPGPPSAFCLAGKVGGGNLWQERDCAEFWHPQARYFGRVQQAPYTLFLPTSLELSYQGQVFERWTWVIESLTETANLGQVQDFLLVPSQWLGPGDPGGFLAFWPDPQSK